MTHRPLVELIDEPSSPLLLRDLYADGDPGPIVGALAQVPELCEATLPFIGAALSPSAVSFRLKEIAILRTSANLACRYCVDAHTVVAFESGLSGDEVRALRGAAPVGAAFDDPAELALIAWIDGLSGRPGPVEPGVGEEVVRLLGDHLVVELTVTVGATMMLNRLATGLRLPTSDETLRRLAELGFGNDRPGTPVRLRSVTS